MKKIEKLLVANRGEVARRVFETCRALGIATVAVYSDADRGLPFVTEADQAVRIGPSPPEASYLAIEAILEAARSTGADAIHPGYGFLAENADFARAVNGAGLVWVGPPPEAMEALGDKAAARKLAQEHGVPVVPGYDGDDQSDETLRAEAERIGFPLLIKAAAGGGGRGMRVVERADEVADALASARREATAAFGNGTLLLERLVPEPRHIEVQVLADTHGNVVHLGERECSVQRRHQKILEEAPSPAVDTELRSRLGSAAIQLAKAAGYVNAGTVEFLLGDHGLFYLLEMNTRLQVEHPVTEEVTGLDLVALQLAVAEGHELPLTQDEIELEGHAIEARLYAEDPNKDYMPSSGRLRRLDLADDEGVRIDAGYTSGDEVSIYYDSMLAKIIAYGPDRQTANRRLARTLWQTWAPGLTTNLPLLREVAANPVWKAGELHTGFLSSQGLPTTPPLNLERGALAATVLAWWRRKQASPWSPLPLGWRVEGPAEQTDAWQSGPERVEVHWRPQGEALHVRVEDGAEQVIRVLAEDDGILHAEVDGLVQTWRVHHEPAEPGRMHVDDGDVLYLHLGDGEAVVRLEPRFPATALEDEPGTCAAPTPGTVGAVHAEVGQEVEQGELLVVLEAMKMEHKVLAPEKGRVAEVRVKAGDTVDQGALLVKIEAEEAS